MVQTGPELDQLSNNLSIPDCESILSRSKEIIAAAARSWSVAALAMGAAVIHLIRVVIQTTPRIPVPDYSGFYISSWAMAHQIDPYWVNVGQYAQMLHVHSYAVQYADYPPTFLLLFEPFTWLDPWKASLLWACLNVILLLAALVLLATESKTTPLPTAVIIVSVATFYKPVMTHFAFLQVQIVVLFLLVLIWRAMSGEKDIRAGALLAFAGLLKVYPLFMMLYLACMRRWRALASTMIFLVVGFALTVAILGRRSFGFFSTVVHHATPHTGTYEAPIVGIGGAIVGIYHRFDPHDAHHTFVLVRYVVEAILEFGTLLISALAIVRAKGDKLRESYAFGLCVAAMTVCYPNSWSHYMVLLLFPFCQIAVATNSGSAAPEVPALAVVAYFLAEASIRTAYRAYRHGQLELGGWLIQGLVLSTIITYIAAYLLAAGRGRARVETAPAESAEFIPAQQNV